MMVAPLAKLASGYLFEVGGFYAVYALSMTITVLGLIYVILLPESLTPPPSAEAEVAPSNGTSVKKKLILAFRDAIHSILSCQSRIIQDIPNQL